MNGLTHRVLAIDGSSDPILHHIAPLGLAAARGTALVIDLDPASPPYRTVTLRSLLDEGVRAAHLRPDRTGVGVIGNGGVEPGEIGDLIRILCEGWPAVVVRTRSGALEWPVVPVWPLLPPPLEPPPADLAVYQATSAGQRAPGRGTVLPRLRRAQIGALLAGRIEPGWRWVRAWREAWELPWG